MNAQFKKSALITGSSSGIGRACALRLAREGFRVFAGVRRAHDGERLRAATGLPLTPVILDVTQADSITAAAREVTRELDGHGLDGLVNVAGIGFSGPLEYVSQENLRAQFEVNVFGQIGVIQSFLPLIRTVRGRIINMSSVGAHVAIPFGGVLCASKSAFGLLSDALRLELRPFGIHVCVIEPGAIRTPAVDKTLGNVEQAIGQLPPEGARRYAEMLRSFTRRAYAHEKHGSSPDVVARAVYHALTARQPRIRYVVGKDAKPLTILPRWLPERLLDGLRMRIFGIPGASS